MKLIINYNNQVMLLGPEQDNRIAYIRWDVSVEKAYFINNKDDGFGIYLYNRDAKTLLKTQCSR